MDGVIVINKPKGKTSHDCVGFVRRLAGTRKVGHTGTLDPLATGVLPICIGCATKASELLTCENKSYTAQLILGKTTDTLDCEGTVLSEVPVDFDEEKIRECIMSFTGKSEQLPPMYSAIKKDGKKLYELARQGIIIERDRRKIEIYSIDILDMNKENNSVTFSVDCSKGTYIRSLCDDIGAKLGCGGYMNTLTRTRSGNFTIDKSHTFEGLEELKEKGRLEEILIPVDELFDYKKITVDDRQRGFIINGVRTRYKGLDEGSIYRVYDQNGNFLCISECVEERLTLKKSFWGSLIG